MNNSSQIVLLVILMSKYVMGDNVKRFPFANTYYITYSEDSQEYFKAIIILTFVSMMHICEEPPSEMWKEVPLMLSNDDVDQAARDEDQLFYKARLSVPMPRPHSLKTKNGALNYASYRAASHWIPFSRA